jgi:hypothetical protein
MNCRNNGFVGGPHGSQNFLGISEQKIEFRNFPPGWNLRQHGNIPARIFVCNLLGGTPVAPLVV